MVSKLGQRVVPDLSKLEPVNYIDANGNVQTYAVDPNNKVNKDNGWTGGAISSITSDIATEFPSITSNHRNLNNSKQATQHVQQKYRHRHICYRGN